MNISQKDIIVIGQVVHNDSSKKPSTNSVEKLQSDHIENVQNFPNGTGPIFERILIHNDHKIHQMNSQYCGINTNNQLFTQYGNRKHSRQNPEENSHININRENEQNDPPPSLWNN